MSELPSGWTRAAIRDVLWRDEHERSLVQGWSPQCEKGAAAAETEWAVLKTTAIQYGEFLSDENKRLPADLSPRPELALRAGDLLITCAGPRRRCGVPCLVGEDHPRRIISGKMYRFRADTRIIAPDYLLGALRTCEMQTQIDAAKTGISDSGLNLTHERFLRLDVPVGPLAEQRRIVAKIDSLSAKSKRARDRLDHMPRLVERYKQAVLEAAFEGRLSREPDTIARGWPSRSVGSVVTRVVAGKNLRCEERPPTSSERGVVKVSAVTWGRFDPAAAKTLPREFSPPENTRIRTGDFLISRANTLELVGAVVIVETAPENLFLSDKVLRLEMPPGCGRWLLWFLRSPPGRRAIEGAATGNQLSMRNLSQEALRAIQVPWPVPDVQARTLTRISEAFAWIERVAAETASARKLIDRVDIAVLSKAFRGELVKPNPADEPASVLLERIRGGRVALSQVRTGRGKRRPTIAMI